MISPSNEPLPVALGQVALEQEGEADVVGAALDLHRLALGGGAVLAGLVELVRARRHVVRAERARAARGARRGRGSAGSAR